MHLSKPPVALDVLLDKISFLHQNLAKAPSQLEADLMKRYLQEYYSVLHDWQHGLSAEGRESAASSGPIAELRARAPQAPFQRVIPSTEDSTTASVASETAGSHTTTNNAQAATEAEQTPRASMPDRTEPTSMPSPPAPAQSPTPSPASAPAPSKAASPQPASTDQTRESASEATTRWKETPAPPVPTPPPSKAASTSPAPPAGANPAASAPSEAPTRPSPEQPKAAGDYPAAAHRSDDSPSINDRFSRPEDKQSSPLRAPKADSLRKHIDLNERSLFTIKLFGGNSEAYGQAIRQLDQQADLAAALRYFDGDLGRANGWNPDDRAVRHFRDLVEQHFS